MNYRINQKILCFSSRFSSNKCKVKFHQIFKKFAKFQTFVLPFGCTCGYIVQNFEDFIQNSQKLGRFFHSITIARNFARISKIFSNLGYFEEFQNLPWITQLSKMSCQFSCAKVYVGIKSICQYFKEKYWGREITSFEILQTSLRQLCGNVSKIIPHAEF